LPYGLAAPFAPFSTVSTSGGSVDGIFISDPLIWTLGGGVGTSASVGVFGIAVSPSQVLDAVTEKFGNSNIGAKIQSAAAALNGNIYVLGGYGEITDNQLNKSCDFATSQAGFVNTATGLRAQIADIPIRTYSGAATAVNGKIYLMGGIDCTGVAPGKNGTATSDVFVYDPGSNTWSSAASLPSARSDLKAVTLNGQIYVMDSTGGTLWFLAPPVYMFTKN
jgi:hypothetical protein